jgi:hypothetical protein
VVILSQRIARTMAIIAAMGAVAYAAGDGNLSMTTVDAAGKPVIGATVIVSSPTQIGGARTVMTDAEGKARFVRLSPGEFKVQVSKNGFQTATLNQVEVKAPAHICGHWHLCFQTDYRQTSIHKQSNGPLPTHRVRSTLS